MTKDEALKMALEHFETWSHEDSIFAGEFDKEITAIKEALAQSEHGWTPERIAGMARLKDAQDKKLAQPEQEPVKFEAVWDSGPTNKDYEDAMRLKRLQQLTTPPQRTWVGLTDEEISELIRATHNTGSFVRAIEAALKAKNT